MKKIFKILAIITLFNFLSCEKDLYEDFEQQKQNYDVKMKKITVEDFNKKLQQLKNKPKIERFMKSSEDLQKMQLKTTIGDNIVLYTDDIKEITYEDYTSYTMYLKIPTTTNNVFYNFVIEEKNDDIRYSVNKYITTNNWLNNKDQDFQGTISTFMAPGSGGNSGSDILTQYTDIEDGAPFGGGGSENSSGGIISGLTTSYPTNCIGVVETIIYVEPKMCSANVHWPWTPTFNNPCTASVQAHFTQTTYYRCLGTISGGGNNTGGGNNGNNPGGGGSFGGGGNTNNPNTGNIGGGPASLTSIVGVTLDIKSFLSLNTQQSNWWNTTATEDTKNSILNYLAINTNNGVTNQNATDFAQELINISANEPNQADVDKLVNMSLVFEKYKDSFDNENFINEMDQYMDADVASFVETNTIDPISIQFTIQCAVLRVNHPTWSDAKIYWEASKVFVHIALDILGLVPVVGEVADLTNGLLYTIEGDGVNAALSVASAVPIVGWASVGTKYAIKLTNTVQTASVISTKVVLTWKVVGNLIDFGNRADLRKVLGLAVGNANQAHHIMPWALKNHDIVQKAAKSGSAFHMNEVLNGIAVAAWRNQPNHNTYNNLILSKLDNLPTNLSPIQAYNEVVNILNQARQAIINNPNVHLNNLTF